MLIQSYQSQQKFAKWQIHDKVQLSQVYINSNKYKYIALYTNSSQKSSWKATGI